MSMTACAQIVEKGDPDRFLAVMAAPVEIRDWLWPLYAFNVEVARAPWVTEEPGIAEIRLQWWRDALEEIRAGGEVRRHEVVEPLAQVVREAGLDVAALDGVVAARRWDIYRDPFEDEAHLRGYLRETSGALMEAACVAGCLASDGLSDAAHDAAAQAGFAQGAANWLMAVPAYEARGRMPMVDGSRSGTVALAQDGLAALDAARAVDMGEVAVVLRAAWRAKGVLQQAERDPAAVAEGRLGGSEFARRFGLMRRAFLGGW